MARIPDLLSGYGPEDEDVIPAGLLDDEEEEEGAGPELPAVGGIAPAPSSAPKSADALLEEAFSYSPPPMVQAEKPKAKAQGRDNELLRAQRDDARSRNQGRASDALYAAFSRRGLQNTGGGTDTAGELLKRRAVEQGEADKTRKAGERMADRASLAKVLGVDEEQLAGLSDEGLSKVLGVKVGERKAAAAADLAKTRATAAATAAQAALDRKTQAEKDERAWKEGQTNQGQTFKAGESEKERQARLTAASIAAKRRATGSGGKANDGMKMTAGETAKIADFDTATKLLDGLGTTYATKASGPGAGLTQWLPATNAKQYNDERKVTAQVVGGILEQGKLTDSDFERYYGMLPDPSDSKERAEAKLAAVRKLIQTRRNTNVETLKNVGFKTGGLDAQRAPTNGDVDLDDTVMVQPPPAKPGGERPKPVAVHRSKLAEALLAGGEEVK